jgi:UPF0755 protein
MLQITRRIINFITLFLGALIFLVLALTGAFLYYNAAPLVESPVLEQNGIRIEADGGVYLEVRKGESAQSVGQRLETAGLIRSRYLWYLLCRFDREYIKSGYYRIESPASQLAIHKVLVSGRQILRRVTIPEGVTLKKTAKILEDANICPADEFLQAASDREIISRYRIPGASMEGYLFPDTYLFPPAFPAVQVVETMANTFFSRIWAIDGSSMKLPPEEINKRVIIASIVEREYRRNEEAPVMAGVFFNRLKIGMALQSCATVEYVITEIQGRPHPEVLSTRDTGIRDPYNTYIRPGLPPGPISAPGMVALKAAFFPAGSEFLYFRLVDTASGSHYFSQTLDDHIRAGLLYVKGRIQ